MRRRCTMPSASHPFHRSCSGSGDCTGLVVRRVDALTAGEMLGLSLRQPPLLPASMAGAPLLAGASGVAPRQLPDHPVERNGSNPSGSDRRAIDASAMRRASSLCSGLQALHSPGPDWGWSREPQLLLGR